MPNAGEDVELLELPYTTVEVQSATVTLKSGAAAFFKAKHTLTI